MTLKGDCVTPEARLSCPLAMSKTLQDLLMGRRLARPAPLDEILFPGLLLAASLNYF